MYVILLRFSHNKSRAPEFMQAHKDWIEKGIDEKVFELVGSLQPNAGGAIIAFEHDRAAIEMRVAEDPFVQKNIVTPEIIEITPSRYGQKLAALVAGQV